MTQARDLSSQNPRWWSESHTSGWERTKEALRRDWEQTKADFTDGGEELNQGVDDTFRQAAGKQAIPPAGVPNLDDEAPARSSSRMTRDWNSVEPAYRYGYGASQHYPETEWNDDFERKLRSDWESTGSDSTWDQVKNAVKRGWLSVKRAV